MKSCRFGLRANDKKAEDRIGENEPLANEAGNPRNGKRRKTLKGPCFKFCGF